jgi:hypothetical protein
MSDQDRFELRTFGRDLGAIADALCRLATPEPTETTREAYFLRRGDLHHNLKARRGRLELKTLVETCNGLQRWHPEASVELPAGLDDDGEPVQTSTSGAAQEPLPAVLVELLGPALRTEPGTEPQLPPDLAALAGRIAGMSGRAAVHVVKGRRRLQLTDVRGELVQISANGATLESIAIEAEDANALHDFAGQVGLADAENVSYVLALHRVLGWEPLPAGSPDRAW